MHIMNFQIKLQKLPIALTSLLREVSDRLLSQRCLVPSLA